MKQVNLYEAKTALSSLVEEAAAGEEIIIAKNGKARARLTSLPGDEPARRPIRWGRWDYLGWELPEGFDSWDDELEAMFYGDANEPSS